MTRKSLFFIVLAFGQLGCNRGSEPPYPEWAEPDPPYRAVSNNGNAFDGYVLAAEQAIQAAPQEADRVSFSESAKKRALERLAKALAKLEASTKLPCEYRYTVQDPFKPDESCRGWRLLGRGLVWRIEEAIQANEHGKAATWVAVATKFGLDLAKGDAQTATLGFTICNEARRAVSSQLKHFSAPQLSGMYATLSKVLSKYPGLSDTVAHEKRRMMLGIQYVQDGYRRRAFENLQKQFGSDSRAAINYLQGLEPGKRVAYFENFSLRTKQFVDHWQEQVDKPKPDRKDWVEPDDSGPWRKFARAFWGTVEPLSEMGDSCIAHTRLFALTSWALAKSKATGAPASTLKGLPLAVTMDPYSGKKFIYVVSGADFRVYSVGEDGKDDLGESDENGLYPDVVLEAYGL